MTWQLWNALSCNLKKINIRAILNSISAEERKLAEADPNFRGYIIPIQSLTKANKSDVYLVLMPCEETQIEYTIMIKYTSLCILGYHCSTNKNNTIAICIILKIALGLCCYFFSLWWYFNVCN